MSTATNDFGTPVPWLGSAGLVLSVGIHAALFVGLGLFRLAPREAPLAPVEFSVVESQPVLPEPQPELPPAAEEAEPEAKAPEPVKPPPPRVVRERAPRPAAQPSPASSAAPAAAEETIADFSGTTLTSEGQGGWASAVGTGGSMNGPIGKAGAAVTGRAREGVQGGVVGGTGLRLVGDADLSRRPTMPSQDVLNRALERNYPKLARQQGIEGRAGIKLRVLADGRLEAVRKESESYPGFGDACLKAMREVAKEGHRAQPPLDKQGQPVATEIRFPCTFAVE